MASRNVTRAPEWGNFKNIDGTIRANAAIRQYYRKRAKAIRIEMVSRG